MEEKLYARSGRSADGLSPQLYSEHVLGVMRRAKASAEEALRFCTLSDPRKEQFLYSVLLAAEYHDLGKLDSENQKVLCEDNSRRKLSIPHEDAGVAYLVKMGKENRSVKKAGGTKNRSFKNPADLSKVLVFSHHKGLPDFYMQEHREDAAFRLEIESDRDLQKAEIKGVDAKLQSYLDLHRLAIPESESIVSLLKDNGLMVTGLLLRLALSCQVNADFGDAAMYASDETVVSPASCRWAERLEALNRFVAQLSAQKKGGAERRAVRDAAYEECLNRAVDEGVFMETCCGAVGIGKTTALMARALRVAQERGLRRIFIILPYTQIIQQSVDVYRKALTLPGENPEQVVAEHHHLADFKDAQSRQMSVLWNAPIVVTTAVQFFETLGSAKPAALRKLHAVPGSVVFIDEAHNSMPMNLWPQEWRWLTELASKWGCHFIFASGSLIKYWEFEDFIKKPQTLPEILSQDLQNRIQKQEQRRIAIHRIADAFTVDSLVERLCEEPEKTKLVVVNTVYTAALVAARLRNRLGEDKVRHLSTALAPMDRKPIIKAVKESIQPGGNRFVPGFVLVATSCVEAGVDLSFNIAYREAASVASLLQIAGRVNRNSEMAELAEVFSFRFLQDKETSVHPGMTTSANILDEMFEEGWFQDSRKSMDDILQEAVKREMSKTFDYSRKLLDAEVGKEYNKVAELCKVIEVADTRTVVVNAEIIRKLESREKVSSRDIQLNSVQIWANKLTLLGIEDIPFYPGLYKWTLSYDPDFLGYMTENCQQIIKSNGMIIV